MKRSVLLVTALGMAASPSAARAPVELAPVKPWNLHYADNSCQLIRSFGDPAKPTTLVLNRLTPDSDMTLMVYGGGLRARQQSGQARAAFLPFADHRFETVNIAETVEDRQPAIMWSTVNLHPGEQPPEERRSAAPKAVDAARVEALRALEDDSAGKVTGLQITEPGGRKVILKTGSMKRAVAMMRECGNEQLAGWGFDPAVMQRIAYRAFSNRELADLFDSNDYPSKALFMGSEAIVSARLHVGADGKVARCVSLTPYKEPAFGEVVCRNLSRASFQPAKLADGTAVPDMVVATIRFQMDP